MEDSYIDIVGTIFDNSTEHTVALASQIKDLNLNKKQDVINQELLDSVNGIQKSKGYFSSFSALIQSCPNPKKGDWAVVNSNNKWLIATCDNDSWTLTDQEYESNIDLSEYAKKGDLSDYALKNDLDNYIKLEDIPKASQDNDGLLSKELYNDLIILKTSTIPDIENDITNLKSLVTDDSNISEIIEKYNTIQEFINNLQDGDPIEELLQEVKDLKAQITNEIERSTNSDSELNNRLTEVENSLNKVIIPSVVTYEIVTESKAGLMSPEMLRILNDLNTNYPIINENLQNIYQAINIDQQETIDKFNAISEFISSLNSEDQDSLLASIIDKVLEEKNRAEEQEDQLKNQISILLNEIQNLKLQIENIDNHSSTDKDNIKHIFLTKDEYDALTEYERDTIYFILEPETPVNGWTFGGTFPITFGIKQWTFGGKFPITFGVTSKVQWTLGQEFPIILS